ncbi:MAG: LysR family transcriptional regulator [Acetatifactor sp.]|nr:LysR family transcriptional regulator [Acetatifactor sp.]
MNIQFLDTFLLVAEVRNFTKASEKLHLSQPTVSWQIKELENMLGVSLFVRKGKAVCLSEAGERFVPMARRIVGEWERALMTMEDFKGGERIIKIGCPEFITISAISDVVGELYTQSERFSVEACTGNFSSLIQKLLKRELDYICIFNERTSIEGLDKLWEREEEVVFICVPTHPLAHRECSLRDLEDYPFILPLRDEVTSYVHKVQECFRKENIQISSVLKLGSVVACKETVIKGKGISILPGSYVRKELENGSLVRIRVKGISITMWNQIFCRQDRCITREDQIFLDKIKLKVGNE